MKNLAIWKNIMPASSSGACVTGGEIRYKEAISEQIVIDRFVLDIPEEITLDDALDKLSDMTEKDEIAFDDEWSHEVRRQFQSGSGARVPWGTLTSQGNLSTGAKSLVSLRPHCQNLLKVSAIASRHE